MNAYLIAVIVLLVADWIKHVATEVLNLRAASPQAPAELADIYEPATARVLPGGGESPLVRGNGAAFRLCFQICRIRPRTPDWRYRTCRYPEVRMNTSPIMLHSFPRAIRHVDGDAFFTSVEQALNPDFRGKPVVTGKELQRPEASISKTKTFSASSDDRDFVYAKLVRNLESACIKLRRHHLRALEIQVSLRTKDYAEAAAGARLSRTFQSAPRGAT